MLDLPCIARFAFNDEFIAFHFADVSIIAKRATVENPAPKAIFEQSVI